MFLPRTLLLLLLQLWTFLSMRLPRKKQGEVNFFHQKTGAGHHLRKKCRATSPAAGRRGQKVWCWPECFMCAQKGGLTKRGLTKSFRIKTSLYHFYVSSRKNGIIIFRLIHAGAAKIRKADWRSFSRRGTGFSRRKRRLGEWAIGLTFGDGDVNLWISFGFKGGNFSIFKV